MFDDLQDRLAITFKKLRGRGTMNEDNIKDALRDVRLSLLEADVNFRVVKEFIKSVKERAMGKAVLESLSPYQDFIRIVGDELTETMGGEAVHLNLQQKAPIVILMMGLQGSGKTTTCGKLAFRLKAEGRTPLLVPADVQRPAAIAQLKTVAKQVGADVFDSQAGMTVAEIGRLAIEQCDRQGQDVMIVDTAGRLHVDLELMEELRDLKELVNPAYSLLVIDAMTGQDAVNVATEFNNQVGISGVVLSKMDGDARGGAALSVRKVTGAPIYFVGQGEKFDALDIFHPDRVAQRVLGMGDMMTLIEKSQGAFDEKKAAKMAKKFKKAEFSLDDFREQMQMMRQMGDMKDMLKMIPGVEQAMKKMGTSGPDPDKEMRKVEAILNSMTPRERAQPKLLNASRRKRIAMGSGHNVSDVNAFMKRFKDAQKMMKRMSKMGPGGLKALMGGMGGGMGGMGRMR